MEDPEIFKCPVAFAVAAGNCPDNSESELEIERDCSVVGLYHRILLQACVAAFLCFYQRICNKDFSHPASAELFCNTIGGVRRVGTAVDIIVMHAICKSLQLHLPKRRRWSLPGIGRMHLPLLLCRETPGGMRLHPGRYHSRWR